MWLYDTKLIPLMVAALEGMKAAHVALQAQRQAAQVGTVAPVQALPTRTDLQPLSPPC